MLALIRPIAVAAALAGLPLAAAAQISPRPPATFPFDRSPEGRAAWAARRAELDRPQTWRLRLSAAAEPATATPHRLLLLPHQQRPGDNAAALLDALLTEPRDAASSPPTTQPMHEAVYAAMTSDPFDAEAASGLLAPHAASLDRLVVAMEHERLVPLSRGARPGDPMNVARSARTSTLARLLALRTRAAVADARFDDAAADLRTLLALARQQAVGGDTSEISTATGIAAQATDALRAFVQHPQAPNLYWAIADVRPLLDARGIARTVHSQLPRYLHPIDLSRRDTFTEAEWEAVGHRLMRYFDVHQFGFEVERPPLEQAAFLAAAYLPSRADLQKRHGLDDAQLAAMSPPSVVGRSLLERYEQQVHRQLKWLALPFPQSHASLARDEKDVRIERATVLMSPAFLIDSVRLLHWTVTRVDRDLAALQTIEAIRAHVAAGDGTLPDRLDALTPLPAPLDPVTGQPFGYERTDRGFLLTSPPPPAERPSDALRIEASF